MSSQNNKTKKGFTIVELVIVIAIIAILSAVLVPTFSNVIENSNVSSDKALIRNINNALEINNTLYENPNDVFELKEVLNKNGIDNISNKSKNHIFYWSKEQNMCFIWGIKEQQIIFPEYSRNKSLDDFNDEIDISTNEIQNLKNNGLILEIPGTGIKAYSGEYKNDWILDDGGKRLTQGNGFVSIGAIEIDVTKYKSLDIYISGVEMEGEGYCRMHIFKESVYTIRNPIIMNNLKEGRKDDYWGLEIFKLSNKYYKISFNMDILMPRLIKENGIEKFYYALSLKGNGEDLIITHNQEIYNIK